MRKLPLLKKVKLDIGCGENPIKGFTGMDVRDCGQDIVWDAREGIPFPDGSVEMIVTSHFLEHLDDEESMDFILECLRVLKPQGQMKNRLPHLLHPTAFYFGHKTYWNEQRVGSLTRLSVSPYPFTVIENYRDEAELKFTLLRHE